MIRISSTISLALACFVFSPLPSSSAATAAEFHGLPYTGDDVFADTWVAVDGAGRTLPGFAECGPVKKDKWAGIFYWTWHTPGRRGPNDNTKILARSTNGPVSWPDPSDYHWGEPELGYDLLINLQVRTETQTTVQAWRNGTWVNNGNASYRVNGNGMELAIRRLLFKQNSQFPPSFDFHWADNIQSLTDISEFGVNGDSAPNRRWNYRFGGG